MAASSSSSTSAAANSNNKSHQVFINHRGVDVKKTFARSLYLCLREKGLTAFLDEEEIQAGYEISSQLADAIRTASVHVAIFSPRYAESDWCLNELLLMLKSNAPIIPVFYGISPVDVRWMLGDYGKALQTHKEKRRNDPSTIEEWRNALHQVANNSGFELDKYNGQDLVLELVDKVVKRLLEMVPKPDLYVAEYPTGLDDKLKDFENTVQLTQQQGRKPQILGIVGLGGVGKTTLATAFFNKKKSDYDRSCFLCDVRENTTNRSLHLLQSQLLNSLIGFNKQVNSVREGKGMLIEHLKSCKAIIILDDVDDVDQVKAFLPQSDVLNSGSLILITSRDKNVLRSSKVENSSIYSLSGLKKEHSLELFCSHAFSQAFPLPEFKSLVYKFIGYCNGLPLSLKIFGALLYGKDISQWKEEWYSLPQIAPSAIQDTFRISYNSLNPQEKDIFLDIACFFRYQNRDAAISIWNSSGWRGNRGFLNLQDKSLVEVDDFNFIHMHDHLRDLGRQVAASSLPRRLLKTKNWMHNLSHQSSEITFRGIGMMAPGEYSGQDDDGDVFGVVDTENAVLERSFRSVQILDMEDCHLEPILRKAKPPKLSCLRWNRCPHSSLPSWVSVKNLRILFLDKCELMAQLWNERSESQVNRNLLGCSGKNHVLSYGCNILLLQAQPQLPVFFREPPSYESEKLEKLKSTRGLAQAAKLRFLAVSWCTELEELPGMETLVSLEELRAEGCLKLKCIQASAQAAKLRYLDVSGCSELKELPSMEKLVSLEELRAKGCRKLKSIRGSAQATNLRSVDVSGCFNLEELPSMEKLVSLQELRAEGCVKLKNIRGSSQVRKLRILSVSRCSELEELPGMGTLVSLEKLAADRCEKLKGIRGLAQATKLRYLDVSWCPQLEELTNMETLVCLEEFRAQGCEKVKRIPALAKATKLKYLDISQCSELQELPSIETLISLEEFRAEGCEKLKFIHGLEKATKLRFLDVSWCSELEYLPSMETLVSLEKLATDRCEKLKSIRGLTQLTNLRSLNVSWCSELEELQGMEALVSLEEFRASGCGKLKTIQGLEQATKLRSLDVSGCSELEELPTMENLVFLEELWAFGLVKLKNIPGLAQATRLRRLILCRCFQLQELPCMETLVSLEELRLDVCVKLKSIRGLSQARNLRTVSARSCFELEKVEGVEHCKRLEMLDISGCPKLQYPSVRCEISRPATLRMRQGV